MPDEHAAVVEVVAAARLVVVVVLDDVRSAAPLGQALADGGLRCVEVTLRTEAAVPAIEAMAGIQGLTVGAGTVLTTAQVDQAVAAGARFVVSPGFDRAVVDRCRKLGVPAFPGVATATEIQAAVAAGVDVVKFFPAGLLGGPAMLAALSAPFPGIRFIPTGGVDQHNAAGYLAVPSVVAVGGTWVAPRSVVRAGDWPAVRQLAAAAANLVRAGDPA